MRGSYTLNAAALVPHSQKKTAVLYALSGLIAGLALSMGWVVVGALVSDRLRSRDDIAHALGAPVRLSVGPVRRCAACCPAAAGSPTSATPTSSASPGTCAAA